MVSEVCARDGKVGKNKVWAFAQKEMVATGTKLTRLTILTLISIQILSACLLFLNLLVHLFPFLWSRFAPLFTSSSSPPHARSHSKPHITSLFFHSSSIPAPQ